MILEGIVTSVSPEGRINIAPMGPRVDAAMQRFMLRPFSTSQTYRNLKAHGEGVLHITDDVLLLAKAALGPVEPPPALFPAANVRGFDRAKHAVVEAAILATRTDFLPLDEIETEYRKLAVIVDKTGGPQEQQAFALLREHVARVRREAAPT